MEKEHLVYITIEFPVDALDKDDAEKKGYPIIDSMLKSLAEQGHKGKVASAKIADPQTGFFLK